MKYAVRTLILMVVALLASSLDANAQPKFRVSWQSTTTGFADHGSWINEDLAFIAAERGNAQYPVLRHWVEEKRKLLFIPLPSKRIALTNVFPNTMGMKAGDVVRYHLPEWKIDKSKTGKIEGLYGDTVLFVDGKAMGVTDIIEHHAK